MEKLPRLQPKPLQPKMNAQIYITHAYLNYNHVQVEEHTCTLVWRWRDQVRKIHQLEIQYLSPIYKKWFQELCFFLDSSWSMNCCGVGLFFADESDIKCYWSTQKRNCCGGVGLFFTREIRRYKSKIIWKIKGRGTYI